MNRSISVSTDVYAAIWAARQPGEESEDAILARLLDCCSTASAAVVSSAPPTGAIGYHDTRNNVIFPEGFEIFRSYKGKEFSAIATSGKWVRRDNGKPYTSLNQLNGSIAAGAENVWNGNWKYRDERGAVYSIDKLRQ